MFEIELNIINECGQLYDINIECSSNNSRINSWTVGLKLLFLNYYEKRII
jgi:hypothetical protein